MMMNKKKPFSLHLDVDSFMPATAEEKEVISRMRPSSTFFRDGVKRLLKNKVATISLILIVLITLSSIIIPMFWPYSYDQMLGQTKGRPMDNSYNNLAPFQYGKTELKKIDKGESVFPHIFGTDAHGRDYFIRVVYGTRISLAVGFFASIIVLVIGMMIGAVAGYFGGRVDLFIMRIVDIIYSLPDMLVIILLAVVLVITHAQTELSVACIGVIVAILTLIVLGLTSGKKSVIEIIKGVDYKTLLFFIGLFVSVAGLEKTGVLNMIANFITSVSEGNIAVIVIVILWLSAITSAFVDNIPFAATMIPVIRAIAATEGMDIGVLAWALSLGTDLGGNATPIGASANVVGTSASAKGGYPIGWGRYCKYCVPATIIVMAVSTAYLFLRYL